MSDELKLSKELIDNVMNTVVAIDGRAKDPFVGSQYLAAIVGYVVGTSSIPSEEKKEIMDELGSFMHHVYQDVSQQSQPQQAQQPQSAPVAPPGSAFGIWKPGDS
ncbi:MAG: hypothetical protein AB8B89_04055 [Gammaproteobacteria bacterium]